MLEMKVEKSRVVSASKTVDSEIAKLQDRNRAKSEDQPTKPAPGRLPVQQGYLMKTASILGIILIVLGIVSLAYFGDPIRLMLRDFEPHKTNSVPPILGGLALVGGIALLFATRPRD
jgi:hypothetical protein